jgi:coproporphyrinogen III oxidase-like Fe-S oxidoreductase
LALPAAYVEKINSQGEVLAWREQLLQKELHFEFFYLGMRKIGGVREGQFLKRFGFAIPEGFVSALNELAHSGFVIRDGDIIRLSAEGISLADSVFERLAGA